VHESAIIEAPADSVWGLAKVLDFHFLPTVLKADLEEKGTTHSTVGAVRRVQYKDNTVQRVRLLELSDAQRFVTWEVIESIPAVTYSSVVHTVRVRRVTEDNSSYVEFTSDFSRDANNGVISDSKFKKLDYFRALAAITESRAALFLKNIDFSTFKALTAAQTEEAWASFDTDKNGTLEPAEVEKVVEAILVKIAAEQNAVHKQLKSMFETADKHTKADSKHAVDVKGHDHKDHHHKQHHAAHHHHGSAGAAATAPKDGAALSSHVLADMKKKVKGATKGLLGRLDKNKDGKIDKAEFVVLFPTWFNDQLTEGVRGAYF